MARGGKRQGSGRRKLWNTPQCKWIVQAVRADLEARKEERHARWLKAHKKGELDERADLVTYYAALNAMPLAKRLAAITDPAGTPLEDTKVIFEMNLVSHHSIVPAPSNVELSAAYSRVAEAATRHFKQRITSRRVKDCVAAWLAFERSLSA